jgi:uncharacterized protein YcaQ
MQPTLEDLRRFAAARSFFPPTSLQRALDRLGFVQADPIRAPARAQDLILRHRVDRYRAGDLERLYEQLGVEEDTFINYGFMPASVHALMFPRAQLSGWSKARRRRAEALLAFVRDRGVVHPREVDSHFAHGRTTNYWGGTSSATTHMLEHMHYAGVLRVVRREAGIRMYGVRELAGTPIDRATRDRQIDALVDVVVGKYAPVPGPSLSMLVSRLRYAVPQWRSALKGALQRVKKRLTQQRIANVDWYWPGGEQLNGHDAPQVVRLLAPFDPVVWDRRRFELLWGWAYRFEAYTPVLKRRWGYYALPLLWRDKVIGWGNLSLDDGELRANVGYVAAKPRERAFARELEAELARIRVFLGR